MVSLGQLTYLVRELQRLLPPGDLAVVRLPMMLLDVEALLRYAPSLLPEIDAGQIGSRRIPVGNSSSLHVHFFHGYVEAHIDATDPARDPAAHVVEVTHVGLAALAGAAVAAITGSWLPAILMTALGASVPSQRRRVFELYWDGTGLMLRAVADAPSRRGYYGRRTPLPRRRTPLPRASW